MQMEATRHHRKYSPCRTGAGQRKLQTCYQLTMILKAGDRFRPLVSWQFRRILYLVFIKDAMAVSMNTSSERLFAGGIDPHVVHFHPARPDRFIHSLCTTPESTDCNIQ